MSAEGVTQKSRRGFPQSFFVYLSGKRTGLKMQMFYSLEELIFISALIFLRCNEPGRAADFPDM